MKSRDFRTKNLVRYSRTTALTITTVMALSVQNLSAQGGSPSAGANAR